MQDNQIRLRDVSECAPLEFTLYTKREVAEAIKEIGKVPAYTVLWKQADLNLTDVPTKGCLAFEQSKNVYGELDPSYGKVKEYTELEGEELPGSGLSARQMARVINFLKKNGNYSLSNTQDMGNCQYAAVQRGTQLTRKPVGFMQSCFLCWFPCGYLNNTWCPYGHHMASMWKPCGVL